MSKTVFCIATSEYQAETIMDELHVAGLSGDQISLLLADKTRAIVRGVTGNVTTDSAVACPSFAAGRVDRNFRCRRFHR